ncbi:MAG: hypothetical protein KKF26_04965, partial [Chloroflexi bacterium]|nr:hypothetical protein [Chloroflexota bacterium]
AVNTTIGEQRFPQSMESWLKQQFGSIEAVARQQIVRVTNQISFDGTIFNQLRAARPVPVSDQDIEAQIEASRKNDPFANPKENTPEDLFGRVEGRYCITASNVAKFDGLHGLVVFNEFNPLKFTREQVVDYFTVGWEWALRAHAMNPHAKYFFLIWNCLWRAAASINHGHAQLVLASGQHYGKIEALRRAALAYKKSYGSNYFNDLYQVHRSVNCAFERDGVKILASLTPYKDDEVVLIADELNLSLKERTYEALACLRDRMGVASFNLSLVTPPLGQTDESWEGFPAMVRAVNRGNLKERSSDIGGMSIYASTVVRSNPFELARKLAEYSG